VFIGSKGADNPLHLRLKFGVVLFPAAKIACQPFENL
jgi:hypothetical protein